MGMFNSMRKPRGFNHQYIYVDERKEKLAKMEEKAKRDLGMLPEKEFKPEDIRGKFVEGTTHLKRRKASGRKPVSLYLSPDRLSDYISLFFPSDSDKCPSRYSP